jgi:hypothetical protein
MSCGVGSCSYSAIRDSTVADDLMCDLMTHATAPDHN